MKDYFMTFFQKINEQYKNQTVFVFSILLILLCIPLKYIFSSIATIGFVAVSLPYFFKNKPNLSFALLLPIALFLLMVLSISWSINTSDTIKGLQKQLPILLFPLCFLFISPLQTFHKSKIFQYYSYGMVGYSLYFIANACFRYFQTKNSVVFFYHDLVSEDLNAIYFSVLVSFALFYFISVAKSSVYQQTSIGILGVFIFLLSSKSVLTIDIILVVCFYAFFSKTKKSVRWLTISVVFVFLGLSLVFVKKVKERFLVEYETAFIDNTVNQTIGKASEKVYNVSLSQAWNLKRFEQNHYFPGTALRVYQLRIFIEMLNEQKILFTGFGLESSQQKIAEKAKEHHLYSGYSIFNYHNQYLQTFSDLGIFGFLILILMTFVNLKNAFQNKNFIHLVFAITMLFLFFTESLFCRQRGILFFITLYCVFNSSNETERKNTLLTNLQPT